MKLARPVCALAIAAAAVATAADPAIEKLFRDAQAKILRNAGKVPRYTCVQNIARTQYPPRVPGRQPSCQELIAARRRLGLPGNIAVRDRLRLDVAVLDGKEMFSWAGAGRFETDRLDALVPGGASGSGGFIGFMASVFGGDAKTVTYVGLSNDQARFEFEVPETRSHYTYSAGGFDKVTGYSGSFFLDPDSAELMRLVVDTAPFPASDPVCQVEDAMDYQRIRIGSGDFLLPEVADMDVVYRNGAEAYNETRYSDCHEFTGESTIHFDDVDTSGGAPAAAGKAQAPLSAKLRLRIGFTQPIDGQTAAAGDAVTGVLLEDVKDKARGVVAHRDDRVYGRIVRFEQDTLPVARWVVAFQFDRIERAGVQQPVRLAPLTSDGVFTFPERGNLVIDRTFHSDWETR